MRCVGKCCAVGDQGCVVSLCPVGAGIGKSMFAYWLLYQWACRGERVVLCKGQLENEAPFLLCSDGVFKLTIEQYDKELRKPETK